MAPLLWTLLVCTAPGPCKAGFERAHDDTCQPAGTGTVPGETDTGSDTDAEPRLRWNAAQVGDALGQAFGEGLPESGTVVAVFTELMSHADTDCPNGGDSYGYSTPDASCTTEDGWVFYGSAPFERAEATEDGVLRQDYWMGQASFLITSPDGDTLQGGGGLSLETQTLADGSGSWSSFLAGTWSYPPAPGWLGAGVSLSLDYAGHWTAGGSHELTIAGGLTAEGASVMLDDFAVTASLCGDQPVYSARVRDDGGYWYEVVSEPGCTGCSAATRTVGRGPGCSPPTASGGGTARRT